MRTLLQVELKWTNCPLWYFGLCCRKGLRDDIEHLLVSHRIKDIELEIEIVVQTRLVSEKNVPFLCRTKDNLNQPACSCTKRIKSIVRVFVCEQALIKFPVLIERMINVWINPVVGFSNRIYGWTFWQTSIYSFLEPPIVYNL